jgi:hypothetical protein
VNRMRKRKKRRKKENNKRGLNQRDVKKASQ